ncbi:MAG: YceD family protein [Acidimicrobiales bacterium]
MTAGRELRLGVGDLLQRPGTRRHVERELRVDQLEVSGSVIDAGTVASLDLTVESTADPGTLTLTGTVTAWWHGTCRRCLDPIEGELESDVHEVFSRVPLDDEVWPIEGDEIDLGAAARESLLLALPLAPLCGESCRGPAPDDFPARVGDEVPPDAESGGEPSRLGDPRWAALDELRFDD